MAINRDANNPAGHRTFVRILAGHIGRVWATKAQRHAKALRAANGNIGAHRARLFE